MESIATWFQDWSDACQYAKECAPDLSFATPGEPWSAFATIAALCYCMWLLNESRLKSLLAMERLHAEARLASSLQGELGLALGRVKAVYPSTANRQAA